MVWKKLVSLLRAFPQPAAIRLAQNRRLFRPKSARAPNSRHPLVVWSAERSAKRTPVASTGSLKRFVGPVIVQTLSSSQFVDAYFEAVTQITGAGIAMRRRH